MSDHREEFKDEYHYPNSVVYSLNDQLAKKDEIIKELKRVVAYYSLDASLSMTDGFREYAFFKEEDSERYMDKEGFTHIKGGKLARETMKKVEGLEK